MKGFTRPISGKVLDLLLSTYPNAISDTPNVSGMSDHLAVIFEVNLKPTRSVKPPHKVYLYNKANFDDLREFMSESSVEENWDMFKTSLIAGMCQFIPQKSSRSKFKLPWIDINQKCTRKIVCIKRPFTPKTTNIGNHLSSNATLFKTY